MSSQIDPDDYEGRIGTTETHDIGTVTRRDVRRYARAVEDDNPLFRDAEHARRLGYDDVVVPPNYLPAIIERDEGVPADELREDGVDPKRFPIDLPPEAVLMGGGQELSFERYVTVGDSIHVEETLTDIYQRESSSMGTLTFLDRTAVYFDEDDERVLTCEETVIIGDRR